MILADKITKLRKQLGWSQEDLAERMEVSRQSVSKWESTTSIPDLNKIILLAELFGVTTDYLLKEDIEIVESSNEDGEPGIIKVTIEDATKFVKDKIEKAKQVALGVMLCVYSVIPLFFLLALSENEEPYVKESVATSLGITLILVTVAIAVTIFIKSDQKTKGVLQLEKIDFELSYGVEGIIKEKLEDYQGFYTSRLALCISMFIISVVPLIVVSLFSESDMVLMLMLVLMFVIVGISLYLLIPCNSECDSYNLILEEGDFTPKRRKQDKRNEKFGAFYWPLVTAIYIGWSLLTMNWGFTWIIWPIAAISFAAFTGLLDLLGSDKE